MTGFLAGALVLLPPFFDMRLSLHAGPRL